MVSLLAGDNGCFSHNVKFNRFIHARACEHRRRSSSLRTFRMEWTFLRWCYTRQFATTIFSPTQRCNIVATLFRMVTLFQHCNAELRLKSSLRIFSCNITFSGEERGETAVFAGYFCARFSTGLCKYSWHPRCPFKGGAAHTYPSPKPTLTLTSHLGQNVGLEEGWVRNV